MSLEYRACFFGHVTSGGSIGARIYVVLIVPTIASCRVSSDEYTVRYSSFTKITDRCCISVSLYRCIAAYNCTHSLGTDAVSERGVNTEK